MSISRDTFNIVGGMVAGVASIANGVMGAKGVVSVLGLVGIAPAVSVPLAVVFGLAAGASMAYLGLRTVSQISNRHWGTADMRSASRRASPLASAPYRR
jgi:hypothetical protein